MTEQDFLRQKQALVDQFTASKQSVQSVCEASPENRELQAASIPFMRLMNHIFLCKLLKEYPKRFERAQEQERERRQMFLIHP
ncbi:hypothetical protein C5B42_06080 [Candidatus Cerribacteria bacterium 'Amazon FNV 2010 28 9']|uniref:Uncharacterized protein n=1 Tax=Candidatus Cerribacteria bacterium 'Amazon FNV 2010 28 9' TaxID=2081795 RepID=A0A317JLY4_9BACT|nr:MAG: hypothetical protein C5B42_06080 [Candidatus Cerribacteria bacterium 'Amazon FNV 2010 28 9']